MNLAYFLVLILIVIAPLLYLFDKRVSYYKKIKRLLVSSAPLIMAYLVWDTLFTGFGVWHFNPSFTLGVRIFRLPIEEILFFPSAIFSMIFIWEVMKFYLKEVKFCGGKYLGIIWVFVNTAIALNNTEYIYTNAVAVANITTTLYVIFMHPDILQRRLVWAFLFFSIIPFFAINSILTSLPVVTYNPEAILGVRVGSIPVEDFLYNIALLMATLVFYEKWPLKNKNN